MHHHRLLTKEDELASVRSGTSAIDTPVRKEDQDRINTFSRLFRREARLTEELKAKKKEKEDVEEVTGELDLLELEATDDTEANRTDGNGGEGGTFLYKIGSSFFSLPLCQVRDLLTTASQRLDADIATLQKQLELLVDEMQTLKITLYARFGKQNINLEC